MSVSIGAEWLRRFDINSTNLNDELGLDFLAKRFISGKPPSLILVGDSQKGKRELSLELARIFTNEPSLDGRALQDWLARDNYSLRVVEDLFSQPDRTITSVLHNLSFPLLQSIKKRSFIITCKETQLLSSLQSFRYRRLLRNLKAQLDQNCNVQHPSLVLLRLNEVNAYQPINHDNAEDVFGQFDQMVKAWLEPLSYSEGIMVEYLYGLKGIQLDIAEIRKTHLIGSVDALGKLNEQALFKLNTPEFYKEIEPISHALNRRIRLFGNTISQNQIRIICREEIKSEHYNPCGVISLLFQVSNNVTWDKSSEKWILTQKGRTNADFVRSNVPIPNRVSDKPESSEVVEHTDVVDLNLSSDTPIQNQLNDESSEDSIPIQSSEPISADHIKTELLEIDDIVEGWLESLLYSEKVVIENHHGLKGKQFTLSLIGRFLSKSVKEVEKTRDSAYRKLKEPGQISKIDPIFSLLKSRMLQLNSSIDRSQLNDILSQEFTAKQYEPYGVVRLLFQLTDQIAWNKSSKSWLLVHESPTPMEHKISGSLGQYIMVDAPAKSEESKLKEPAAGVEVSDVNLASHSTNDSLEFDQMVKAWLEPLSKFEDLVIEYLYGLKGKEFYLPTLSRGLRKSVKDVEAARDSAYEKLKGPGQFNKIEPIFNTLKSRIRRHNNIVVESQLKDILSQEFTTQHFKPFGVVRLIFQLTNQITWDGSNKSWQLVHESPTPVVQKLPESLGQPNGVEVSVLPKESEFKEPAARVQAPDVIAAAQSTDDFHEFDKLVKAWLEPLDYSEGIVVEYLYGLKGKKHDLSTIRSQFHLGTVQYLKHVHIYAIHKLKSASHFEEIEPIFHALTNRIKKHDDTINKTEIVEICQQEIRSEEFEAPSVLQLLLHITDNIIWDQIRQLWVLEQDGDSPDVLVPADIQKLDGATIEPEPSRHKVSKLDNPIAVLNLSVLPSNALLRANINTVGQLLALFPNNIGDVLKPGNNGLIEIREKLEVYLNVEGLTLGGAAKMPEASQHKISQLNRPIESLRLSVRSYNALRRARINTVNQLLALYPDDINNVRNLGPGSLDEIREKLEVYVTNNINDSMALLIDEVDNQISYTDSIDVLGLSTRTYHALIRGKVSTIDQLLVLLPDKIFEIRNVGQIAVDEIRVKLKAYLDVSLESAIIIAQTDIHEEYFPSNEVFEQEHSVALLGLSKITQNALILEGIKTVDILANTPTDSLLEINGLNDTSITEIESALEQMPFILKHSSVTTIQTSTLESQQTHLQAFKPLLLGNLKLIDLEEISQYTKEDLVLRSGLSLHELVKIEQKLRQNHLEFTHTWPAYPVIPKSTYDFARKIGVPLEEIFIKRLILHSSCEARLIANGILTLDDLAQKSQFVIDQKLGNSNPECARQVLRRGKKYFEWLLVNHDWEPEIHDTRPSPIHKYLLEGTTLENIVEAFLTQALTHDRYSTIINHRYGLNGTKPKTLQEIGELLHVSRERVRQMEKKALTMLTRASTKGEISSLLVLVGDEMQNRGGLMAGKQLGEYIKSLMEIGEIDLSGSIVFLLSLDGRFSNLIKGSLWAINSTSEDQVKALVSELEQALNNYHAPMSLKQVYQQIQQTDWYFDTPESARVSVDFLEACLSGNSKFEFLGDGMWALEKWRRGYSDEVVMVLRDADEPLHFKEVALRANKLLAPGNQVKANTVHGFLDRRKDLFVWTGRGKYGLADWGIEETRFYRVIVQEILKGHGNPLTFDKIFELVNLERNVKRGSLSMLLTTNPNFKQFPDEKFGLASWASPADSKLAENDSVDDSFLEQLKTQHFDSLFDD